MLKDVEWSEDRAYKSGSENEPFEFFPKDYAIAKTSICFWDILVLRL